MTAVKPGIRIPKINESVAGTPLLIGNIKFSRGVGTQTLSTMLFDVHGKGKYFRAKVGVDDSSEKGSASFYVLGDNKILWESGLMRKGDAAKQVDLDIRSISKLGLLVLGGTEGSRRDYGDWAEAQIKFSGPVPTYISGKNIDTIGILTPPAPQEPRINGPKIYGMRPGKPFLYRIPVTGERPINFDVTSLPGSLKIDKKKGIIYGSISKPGTYVSTLPNPSLNSA